MNPLQRALYLGAAAAFYAALQACAPQPPAPPTPTLISQPATASVPASQLETASQEPQPRRDLCIVYGFSEIYTPPFFNTQGWSPRNRTETEWLHRAGAKSPEEAEQIPFIGIYTVPGSSSRGQFGPAKSVEEKMGEYDGIFAATCQSGNDLFGRLGVDESPDRQWGAAVVGNAYVFVFVPNPDMLYKGKPFASLVEPPVPVRLPVPTLPPGVASSLEARI